MTIAFYSVDTDSFRFPKSYIVRVFKNDSLVRTVNFPICNNEFPERTLNQAAEFGRLAVHEIINLEFSA